MIFKDLFQFKLLQQCYFQLIIINKKVPQCDFHLLNFRYNQTI